ncbi:putative F-box/LRR-repeat protein [Gracilariopsis chorda]|uniref:Putative F-box/LRR-repeat protein n=1 Tax=Gracilariopsis chorda TaxID=448386 RepID=A0A2V3IY43_9FLOR|nr:putative F-box/LRR-repeat protein [Gracilariopsis chorda]|eukprot:PXF46985.1 putative F-box/LRR-repeat protein [Gracilariopsis chorda]
MHAQSPACSSPSPFVDLGPDVFELLLGYLCGEPLSTAISTDAYRRLLPFAICCTQHYDLTIRCIKGLSLLPLHFTQRSTVRSAPPVPPFPVALYSFYSPAYHHYGNQSSRHALGFSAQSPSRTSSLDVHLPRAVKSFPNLRTLHIYRTTRLSNQGFNALILSLPNLRELLVSANHHLTLDAIRDLPSCSQLQTLELSYCTGLGGEQSVEGGQLIARLTHLRTLSVAYWNIADQFVEHVSHLPHLETLDLSMCNRLTSRSCFHLARNAKRLRNLKFRCSMHLTDSGLRALAACSNLESVNFSLARRISDAGVQVFGDAQAMPNLHTVLLSQCHMLTDAGVSHLSSNQAIRRLDLSYCDCLTERIAHPLTRLRNLEEIDLTGCQGITDQVVQVLAQCTSLRSISLAYCSRLTDASVSALCSSARKEPYSSVDLRNCCDISVTALTNLSSRCQTLKSALQEKVPAS